jgi:hypothetical protein
MENKFDSWIENATLSTAAGNLSCSVCFEAAEVQETLDCSHPIHSNCAVKLSENKCPECRRPLKGQHITQNILDEISKRIENQKGLAASHSMILAALVEEFNLTREETNEAGLHIGKDDFEHVMEEIIQRMQKRMNLRVLR